MLQNVAPTGRASEYDRQNLTFYAELLDAEAAGMAWEEVARSVLELDESVDADVAHLCWESHLLRARWIIGEGLASAIRVFGERAHN